MLRLPFLDRRQATPARTSRQCQTCPNMTTTRWVLGVNGAHSAGHRLRVDAIAGDFLALEALAFVHRLFALESRLAFDRPIRASVGRAVLRRIPEDKSLDELR